MQTSILQIYEGSIRRTEIKKIQELQTRRAYILWGESLFCVCFFAFIQFIDYVSHACSSIEFRFEKNRERKKASHVYMIKQNRLAANTANTIITRSFFNVWIKHQAIERWVIRILSDKHNGLSRCNVLIAHHSHILYMRSQSAST